MRKKHLLEAEQTLQSLALQAFRGTGTPFPPLPPSLHPWITPRLLKVILSCEANCVLQQGKQAKAEHLSHANMTLVFSSHLTLYLKTTLPAIKTIGGGGGGEGRFELSGLRIAAPEGRVNAYTFATLAFFCVPL